MSSFNIISKNYNDPDPPAYVFPADAEPSNIILIRKIHHERALSLV